VYPERVWIRWKDWATIILTCGGEYLARWRFNRRQGAVILTDHRLLHVASRVGRYTWSLKVDMYMTGAEVKHVSLTVPRVRRFFPSKSSLLIATPRGALQIVLRRLIRHQVVAQHMWEGLGLLEDAPALVPCKGTASDVSKAPVYVCGRRDSPALHAGERDWRIELMEGEEILWGPVEFRKEILVGCYVRRFPSTCVTITNRRIAIAQYSSWILAVPGCVWCSIAWVSNVSVLPLRCVLGFCIEEQLSMHRTLMVKLLARCCFLAPTVNALQIRIRVNAGLLGKVYFGNLVVHHHTLPGPEDSESTFEAEEVIEVRRWLGSVALFAAKINRVTASRTMSDVEFLDGSFSLQESPRGLVPTMKHTLMTPCASVRDRPGVGEFSSIRTLG